IGSIVSHGDTYTVWEILIAGVLNLKKLCDAAADNRAPLTSQELAQSMVAAQNAPDAVVDQYRVADGIKSIFPLTLYGSDLFKQVNVLKRQSEQVRDVDEIR